MTITENPLEEGKFSLASTQLKTEEITQCIYIYFSQGQYSIRSHCVIRFHEVPHCWGENLQGGCKEIEAEPISITPTHSKPPSNVNPSISSPCNIHKHWREVGTAPCHD